MATKYSPEILEDLKRVRVFTQSVLKLSDEGRALSTLDREAEMAEVALLSLRNRIALERAARKKEGTK